MPEIAEYSADNYKKALLDGEVNPPNVFPMFVNADPKRYADIRKDSKRLDLRHLRIRMDNDLFNNVRSALCLTLRRSNAFFPTYRFLVDEFLTDEWLSAVDWHKAFHRDHVLHQPMVAYVGLNLLSHGDWPALPQYKKHHLLNRCLDALLNTGGPCAYLWEYMRRKRVPKHIIERLQLDRRYLANLFLDTFFLACMYHDIGYPWQFLNTIQKTLGNNDPLPNPADPGAKDLAQRFKNHLFTYPLRGYAPANPTPCPTAESEYAKLMGRCFRETHGLHSAIALLHLNDIVRHSPDPNEDPLRLFCVDWAAMAILMHDLGKIYGKAKKGNLEVANPHLRVSFNRDPLSFMLTLSDLIQDFGRPDATFTRNPDNRVQYNYRCDKTTLDIDSPGPSLTIHYHYPDPDDRFVNRHKHKPNDSLLFFDPARGYLDCAGSGIERIAMNVP